MELYTWSPLSVIRDKRQRCNCPPVSRDMSTFSTSTNVHSYSSDMPNVLRSKISDFPLNFGTLPKQIQRRDASQPLGTLEHPNVGQSQTIYPFPTTKISLQGWQQSASLPQDSLGPHPQSQARVKSNPLGTVLRKNTSFRQPPEFATMRLRCEVVHKSWSRVTSSPPR